MEKQRDENETTSARPTCYDCVYAHWDLAAWVRTISVGQPARPICANHPDSPGRLREVPLTGPCPNFRPKRQPPVRLEPPAPPNEDVCYIALTRGKFAMVDREDFERLNRYRWNAFRSGGKLYARRSVPGGTILMHREIMQPPPGMVVDHVTGHGLNNSKRNLRVCTPRQNEHNKPPRGRKSRFKGVYRRRNKWYAAIKYKGVPYYLGTFDDEVEAARARDRKAYELQGPYAYLNFPEDYPDHPAAGPAAKSKVQDGDGTVSSRKR